MLRSLVVLSNGGWHLSQGHRSQRRDFYVVKADLPQLSKSLLRTAVPNPDFVVGLIVNVKLLVNIWDAIAQNINPLVATLVG